MLNRLRTMEYAVKNSGWLMLDSVDSLFKNAKSRVYNEKNGEFVYTNLYYPNMQFNDTYTFRLLYRIKT